MYNIKIYESNCREDILSKMQLEKKHVEYNIGKSLSATSDVGKFRDNQEDSVTILEHPLDSKFKLIGVSDGVGGQQAGEIVSNHIVKKLTLWFEKLPLDKFEDMKELKSNLIVMLYDVLNDLKFNSGAATLSAAIVGENETIIVNIGDSRIYTYKNGNLKQETIDDSEVEFLYHEEVIPSRELMRFHKKSNVITQAIDFNHTHYFPRTKIIDNNSYDRLFAFTDGVTDCLSTDQMENIIINSGNKTTSTLVDIALNNDSLLWNEINKLPENEREVCYELSEFMNEDYWQDIPGGKDNTTAAEYRKR